jgi:ubiquinone/menaquinone biosynthesis C-methylase UbiE
MSAASTKVTQCQKPSGLMGRFTLWRMNASHSSLTDWGLTHISVEKHYTILDVGCGGGRTVGKLAALATEGKIYGVDYSDESVAFTKKYNARGIELGRVEALKASVSQLPFPDATFDLVTAIETHFWWPDLLAGTREIFRVLKPGGQLILIAEVHKGANSTSSKLLEKYAPQLGMTLLSEPEHQELLANAGFSDIRIDAVSAKGWISAVGKRP